MESKLACLIYINIFFCGNCCIIAMLIVHATFNQNQTYLFHVTQCSQARLGYLVRFHGSFGGKFHLSKYSFTVPSEFADPGPGRIQLRPGHQFIPADHGRVLQEELQQLRKVRPRVHSGVKIIKLIFFGTDEGMTTAKYTIMIKHQLSIYTSIKSCLLSLKLLVLALNSLDTLSDVRIKVFTLLV